ncbi:hypothetical protein E2C01_026623 [Portunus trituberculatus]|uniref:Uncharacterized protein n=1 Tax=Portunus trituberculatus TaxID=210409 RepID=A0A5B7EIU1_PORTR|nr:hypothetical protein [Portunus trituberculatus]
MVVGSGVAMARHDTNTAGIPDSRSLPLLPLPAWRRLPVGTRSRGSSHVHLESASVICRLLHFSRL